MALFEVNHLSATGLQDISLSLSESELVCLSGPSGSGKTLLLRSLADLDVNQGDVFLDSIPRHKITPTLWRSQVGYLPADSRWWAATVGEHFPVPQLELLAQLGFKAEVLEWNVERLSSGERQRLALARLLANRPRVLLLDEPSANLDADNTRHMEALLLDYLKQHRATCLWVTHAPDQIERVASRVLYLDAAGLRQEMAA
jgi:ABC-type iron transport system FetAB ATPase subunit